MERRFLVSSSETGGRVNGKSSPVHVKVGEQVELKDIYSHTHEDNWTLRFREDGKIGGLFDPWTGDWIDIDELKKVRVSSFEIIQLDPFADLIDYLDW